MSDEDKIDCRSCGHAVDASSKICPYCGANPSTGERSASDRADLEEILPRKPDLTAPERFANTIRSRSGLFLAVSLIVGIALLIGISTWLNERQRESAAEVPPVPLTEITDLNAEGDAVPESEAEMPELELEFDGDPATMETFILEQGEVAPPPEEMENEE